MKLKKYPEYKDSYIPWLREIPKSWELHRAKWYIKSKKEINTDEACINVLSLTLRGVVDNNPNNPEGLVPSDYKSYQIFEKNNLVFKLIDLENYKTSRVGIVHRRGIMSPAYIRVIVDSKSLSSLFYYYFYYNLYLRGVYNKIGAGVRSMLTAKNLLDLPIPIPEIQEQNKIVLFLDVKLKKIANFIKKKRKLIELLNEQKQAIINQAVTRGINSNVKMKPSGVEWLGDIPENWKIFQLKRIAKFNPSKSELFSSIVVSDIAVFLPMEAVSVDGKINCKEKRKVSEIWNGFSYFKKGDVVVAKITPCFENGKGAHLDFLATNFGFGTTEFVVIRPSKKICGGFLYFITMTSRFRKNGEEAMTGAAGQKRVPTDFMKNYIVALPNIEEQLEILNFIKQKNNEIDRTIKKTKTEIELIQEYRTRLISDVVTGKLDVRNINVDNISDEEIIDGLSINEETQDLNNSIKEVSNEY